MRKENQQTNRADFRLYAIVDHETMQVFIGRCLAQNTYQAYKDHVNLRYVCTKNLFELSRKRQVYPPMYLLEDVHMTKSEAYGHMVVWTKYYLDHGFQVLTTPKTLQYAGDLLEKNQTVYDRIKGQTLEEIVNETTLLHVRKAKEAGKRQAKRDGKKHVTVLLSDDEYKLIKQKASNDKLSMTRYCRQIILNHGRPTGVSAIAQVSFWEFAKELKAIKRTMKEIQLGIYQSGKYYPADLENLGKMIKRVDLIYKKMIRQIEKQLREFMKTEP